MVRVLELYYKNSEGNEFYPNKVLVYKDIGIKEDKNSSKKGRNISFIVDNDKRNVEKIDGLCAKRFKANITISGVMEIKLGDVININGAILKVTEIGKRCFDGCHIAFKDRCNCPLKNIFYCDVIENGEIYIDSILEYISID